MSEQKANNHSEEAQGPAARRACEEVGPALNRLLKTLLPGGEAATHFAQAQLELLKGIRAILDQTIQSRSEARPGTRINVE